jgi:hypothetical protein
MDKYEGKGIIQLNGRTLAEATKISVTVKSQDSVVVTMLKGMTGFSDGAGMTEASIESAVPIKGYEADLVEAVRSKLTVKLVTLSGGRRHQTEGRITEAAWSNQSDSPTLLTGSFQGKMLKSLGG